jgi:hypothetical protein
MSVLRILPTTWDAARGRAAGEDRLMGRIFRTLPHGRAHRSMVLPPEGEAVPESRAP